MSNLKGKVAVVTGASKGIGAGIARALGAAGASVVVNYASDKAGADKVVADITKAGGQGRWRSRLTCRGLRIFPACSPPAQKEFGTLDVLVN